MNLIIGKSSSECFCDHPDTAVIDYSKLSDQFLIIQVCEIVRHQTVYVLLQGADGFHQGSFEVVADAHDLAGCFHLRGQCSLGTDKFIERQTRNLDNTVVQHWLKTCIRFACDGIFDLIQCVAQCDLCGNFCDRVAGCFGCQCGGTGYTRVYFDHAVFDAFRVQGVLYVASAGDVQLADDVQGGGTQHLIFFIAKGLGRCYDDTVSGVHADRVDVFHVADGDAVAGTIPHDFVLDLFPSGDAAFYQNLSYS